MYLCELLVGTDFAARTFFLQNVNVGFPLEVFTIQGENLSGPF